MKRATVLLFLALAAHAQTRIASDIEIRQMEEDVRRALDFDTRVAAHVNLGELRRERNESAAAQREYETALQLARKERDDARRDHHIQRYALACSWSGVALAGLGRGVEAFAVLEEGVRYAADLPGVWNLYSVAMFRLGRPEKAIGAARMSVNAAERKTGLWAANVRELIELNVDRYALAEGLLDGGDATDAGEAEQLLRRITQSLEGDAFQALRKDVGKREEFQIVAAPTTESGMYLSIFNRSHMRLAELYEKGGSVEKARREYQAVVARRSDEPAALAGLARLASDAKERDRYLIQSLDANPFAMDVIDDYERHVASGTASPATTSGSVGARIRLAIQQIHDRDFRRARETLKALLTSHPNNDVLLSLVARAELQSGDATAAQAAMASIADPTLRADAKRMLRSMPADHPWFLAKPVSRVVDASESDLRVVLSLFAANKISAGDRATLDREELSSRVMFDAPDGDAFARGTMSNVPFRFQNPTRFNGIASAARPLRMIYRILGATTVDGRDALLIEPVSAVVEE
jgi:tetratricopeptide (TPR) repeat protein